MKKLNRFIIAIVILIVMALLSYGFDQLMPVMKQSSVWHAVIIGAGVVLLLLFTPMVYLTEKHNPKNSLLQKILLVSFFFLLGLGVLLYGLSFWVGQVMTFAFILIGAAMIAWGVNLFLLLRSGIKNKKLVTPSG
jgi:hypothetical protein